MTDPFVLSRYADLHITGEHCGSTAMLNLLRYHTGTTLREESVLGLSGAIWFFLILPPLAPAPMAIGRTITLETGICEALGLPYTEQPAADAEAWEVARAALGDDTPVVLMGDSSQLDYFGGPPFPGHRYLLVGYDEGRGVALIGDRKWPDLQEVSFESLARSRSQPGNPLSALNLWGVPTAAWPGAAELDERVRAAARPAVRAAAERMVSTGSDGAGLAGIEAFARLVGELGEEELRQLCQRNAFSIERAGNAGGFFRRMYAAFIRQQQDALGSAAPSLAAAFDRIARAWTEVASVMAEASDQPRAQIPELTAGLGALAELERAAWSSALDELS